MHKAKKKPKQVRMDYPVGCRVKREEIERIRADIALVEQDNSGIPVSLGAYTKHAVLDHARLHRLEASLKDIVQSNTGAEVVYAAPLLEQLRLLLGSS
jgi:hypothetical protein